MAPQATGMGKQYKVEQARLIKMGILKNCTKNDMIRIRKEERKKVHASNFCLTVKATTLMANSLPFVIVRSDL